MTYPLGAIGKRTRRFAFLVVALAFIGSAVACGQSDRRDPEALFEAMELTEGNWAADVGSGDGDYTLPMASIVGASGRIFAVDIDEGELRELHDKIEDENIGNITTIFSIYDDPMLPDASLDAVLIRNAYHEFTANMSMLRHIKQALKPGGILVMAEYVDREVYGASRDRQVEDHNLAMKYAEEELKRTGFDIVRRDTLRRGDWGHFWMLKCKRP